MAAMTTAATTSPIKIDNGVMRTKDWCATISRPILQSITHNPRFETLKRVIEGRQSMHRHQERLLALTKQIMTGDDYKTNPTHKVLYCSPTGTGKTSSIPLLVDALKHMDSSPVLILTVPCVELLKRMSSELAASRANAWCARKMPNGYSVFRMPACKSGYVHQSLRRSDDDRAYLSNLSKNDKMAQDIRDEVTSPTIAAELIRIADVSTKNKDITPGRCSVILADIESTRELLKAIHNPPAPKPAGKDGKPGAKFPTFLHPDNVILFIDEPNFGLGMSGHHMAAILQSRIAEILNNAPRFTILASATLSDWDNIPEWWRGNTQTDGGRHIITADPYGQPHTTIGHINHDNARMHTVHPLAMFSQTGDLQDYITSATEKDLGFLSRFFDDTEIARLTKSATTPTSLRENRVKNLVPYIKELAMKSAMCELPVDKSGKQFSKLKELIKPNGINLFYSNTPMRTAREICGLADDAEWQKLIAKMKQIKRQTEQQEKHRVKLQSKSRGGQDEEDEYSSPTVATVGSMTLTADEIENISVESLALLYNGIVISTADIEPEIGTIFQEIILSGPDSTANYRLPINILVCDYNGLYGLDCPGVCNVVLCDNLADLPRDDLIQFIGRLRVPGMAMFESARCIQRIFKQTETPIHQLVQRSIGPMLMPADHVPLTCLKQLIKQQFCGLVLTTSEAVLEVYLAMLHQSNYKELFKMWRELFDDYGAEYTARQQLDTRARVERMYAATIEPTPVQTKEHVLKVLSVVFDFDD